MNSFWGNVLEYFKDRRFSSVFFGTLFIFFLALVAGEIIYKIAESYGWLQYWPFTVPGFVLCLVAFVWRGIRRMRARARDRYDSTPLSRDEIAKAKSRLAKRVPVQISKKPERSGKSSRSPSLPRPT